jgi:chorismate-pyruvate lyase
MPEPPHNPAVSAPVLPYIYPLDDFYARAGLPLPKIKRLPGEEVPEPFRSLLVHGKDMTPTLEKFHGADIHLQILDRDHRNDFYYRQVLLRLKGAETIVEFGANKISLLLFPPRARQLILEERVPLGRILKDCDVKHHTVAKAFFELQPDRLICRAFQLEKPATLYGRKATIFDSQQRPLSEIVEILPPAARRDGGG